MAKATVLIVSNTDQVVSGIELALASTGHSISVARSAQSARSFLTTTKPEIILVDLSIRQSNDELLCAKFHEYSPSSDIILLCTADDISLASELVNQNVAYDYFIVRPLYDNYRLPIAVRRALETRSLMAQLARLSSGLADSKGPLDPQLSVPGEDRTTFDSAPVTQVGGGLGEFAYMTDLSPEPGDSVSDALAPSPSTPKRKQKEKRILVVEDDEATMSLIDDILSCLGYDVLKAETATKGIQIAREQLPNLILLDIMLPGMNGIAALQKLKKNLLTAEIPVIMMTSFSDRTLVDQCIKEHCDDYIVKPFSKEVLEDRVRRQMDNL